MQIPHEFLIPSKLLYPLPHDDGMVRGCDYGMRMSMITIDWLIVTSQQVFNGIQPNERTLLHRSTNSNIVRLYGTAQRAT